MNLTRCIQRIEYKTRYIKTLHQTQHKAQKKNTQDKATQNAKKSQNESTRKNF